ncbi:hypothetical protein F5890DRAFT_1420762 [Lentinula detonsa]|uniref:SUN domain-containing protein n=1 Tax=Lentinula detonsa TaxID=2804962 RepID=A0AA38PQC3_9AGAR|nr:hypothetical protein F5890DRAFT_1420762 [Lentinula detonsa]
MEEIPPPCDYYYSLGRFCVDCATSSLPLPNQHPSSFLAPDYVLSPEGAIVIDLTSPTLLTSHYSPEQYFVPTPPIAVIEEDVRVSRCWKFSGSQGHVAVKLAKPIRLTNMTVYSPDHRELPSWRRAEAPKLFRVWALLPSDLAYPMSNVQTIDWQYFLIADGIQKPTVLEDASTFVRGNVISYDIAHGTKQTFSVNFLTEFRTAIVIIEVLDNWGATTTCLHRLAVHGVELIE